MNDDVGKQILDSVDRIANRLSIIELLHQAQKETIDLRNEVKTLRLEVTNAVERNSRDVGRLSETVYGDDPPGLKTLVDRLNQDFEQRRWERRLMWGSIITLGISLFVQGVFLFAR